jgi:hypothetical protein
MHPSYTVPLMPPIIPWLASWMTLFSPKRRIIREQNCQLYCCKDILVEVETGKMLAVNIIRKGAKRLSQPLRELQPLLKQWLDIADATQVALDNLIEDCMVAGNQDSWEGFVTHLGRADASGGFLEKVEGLCVDHYVHYLEAGAMFLRERGAYDIEKGER